MDVEWRVSNHDAFMHGWTCRVDRELGPILSDLLPQTLARPEPRIHQCIAPPEQRGKAATQSRDTSTGVKSVPGPWKLRVLPSSGLIAPGRLGTHGFRISIPATPTQVHSKLL
jgi:hypothetical protein